MVYNIKLLFWLYKSKVNSKGFAPIFLRITINKQRTEIATGQYIQPKYWNSKKGVVKPTCSVSAEINKALGLLKNNAIIVQTDLLEKGMTITPEVIKYRLSGKNIDAKTLLQAFEYHNTKLKQQLGREVSKATYTKYNTLYRKVVAFLNKEYKRDDIYLQELNHQFVTEFELFLKTVENISHNPTIKYIQFLKKIINMSIANSWLDRNPFQNIKCRLQEMERGYLTEEELRKIEHKEIANERLSRVRDMFIFSCYTGLSYSDIKKLSRINLVNKEDGIRWIVINRTKTGVRSAIPLLAKAILILDKYLGCQKTDVDGPLLPVLSNQKMNAYLKEVAEICDIKRKLHFHLSRHTFSTTVTLSKGVPIETVSKMLGHTNLKTTAIYAKVVDTKVYDDMKKLM